MTISLILLVLCIGGGYGAYKFDYHYDALSFLSGMIGFLSGCFMVIHVLAWLYTPYGFNKWVAEREAFVQTLEQARAEGRDLEAAAIVKEVVKWNQSLARNKYKNTIWFHDDYIDDRVEDLEPIR